MARIVNVDIDATKRKGKKDKPKVAATSEEMNKTQRMDKAQFSVFLKKDLKLAFEMFCERNNYSKNYAIHKILFDVCVRPLIRDQQDMDVEFDETVYALNLHKKAIRKNIYLPREWKNDEYE